MSYKQQINKSKGFTIIEVLIVLAIAGLILLIVFLAVPALQRSARNTQRKNDVSAVLGGMSEYADNNNGTLPTSASLTSGTVIFKTGATGEATSSAKIGYYTAAPSINAWASGDNVSSDTYEILTGAECSGNAAISGPTNSYVALYGIEKSGGGWAEGCVE